MLLHCYFLSFMQTKKHGTQPRSDIVRRGGTCFNMIMLPEQLIKYDQKERKLLLTEQLTQS